MNKYTNKYTRHTPGPWEIAADKYLSSGEVSSRIMMRPTVIARAPKVGKTATVHVADVSGFGKEANANAFLIAAAPSLLKAADLLHRACMYSEGDTIEVVDFDLLFEAFREASFAVPEALFGTLDPEEIAKATAEE